MKKNNLKKIIPFALAAIFAAPFFAPAEGGVFEASIAAAAPKQMIVPVGTEQKLAIGTVTVYDYGKVKLHAYSTNDPMADEFYAIESKEGLVLLESGALKDNVQEFWGYLEALKKPLKGMLLSYHPNGYTAYDSKAPIYATEGALASWGEQGGVRALTNNFVQGFGAGKVATDLPDKATIVKVGETVKIAGIDFKILGTPDPEGNYSVEIPAINAVYRHMMGSKVHNILPAIGYIDAEIAALEDYRQKGYGLILTSHHAPEGQEAVAEKLAYLNKVKELAGSSEDKETFLKAVRASFPDYQGDLYLDMTAGFLFK